MSLKKYEAFVRTVELGSLTRAAEAMGSTQSRISHVLSTLEEEYGFVLLRRNRSGVRLTEAGEMVLPKMQEILQKDRELTELIGDIRSADAGTVRLGAFTSVAVHWLPGMIRTFQSAHPKAELKMFNGDYHDMEQWLREGEVDLGFVTLPAPDANHPADAGPAGGDHAEEPSAGTAGRDPHSGTGRGPLYQSAAKLSSRYPPGAG